MFAASSSFWYRNCIFFAFVFSLKSSLLSVLLFFSASITLSNGGNRQVLSAKERLFKIAVDRTVILSSPEYLKQDMDITIAQKYVHKMSEKETLSADESKRIERFQKAIQNHRTGPAFCLGFILRTGEVITADHCGMYASENNLVGRIDSDRGLWPMDLFLEDSFSTSEPGIFSTLKIQMSLDIATVQIDPAIFGEVAPLSFSSQLVEKSRSGTNCYYFSYFNLLHAERNVDFDPIYIDSVLSRISFASEAAEGLGFASGIGRRLGVGRSSLFNSLIFSGQVSRSSEKPDQIGAGDSGGAILCIEENGEIAFGGVITGGNSLNKHVITVSVPHSEFKNKLEALRRQAK